MQRTTSAGRRTRDDATKELSTTPAHPGTQTDFTHARRASSKYHATIESARVLATERLRLQAETLQNQNIVMELSLDGDHFIWLNYAWRFVVGYVYIALHRSSQNNI